jgi:hypothetical protein
MRLDSVHRFEPKHHALIRPGKRHLCAAQQRTAGEVNRLPAVDDGRDDIRHQEAEPGKPERVAALGSAPPPLAGEQLVIGGMSWTCPA